MSKWFVFALIAAGAAGALLGAGAMSLVNWPKESARVASPGSQPRWTEVKWPLPVDQWGTGKAFECAAADCGSVVSLLIRAKIGFCNCATGVADDEELERVADVDLFAAKPTPVGAGQAITVGPMKGRSRGYIPADSASASAKSVLAIAYNERCDVIVATVAMQHNQPTTIEKSAIEFLNGDTVMHWAALKLGL
jgi:hypothetical protein